MFDDTNSTDIKDFESLVSFYIPEVDTVTANCELQIWKQKLKGLVTNKNEMLPSNALDAIRCCDPIIFPNTFVVKNFVLSPCFYFNTRKVFFWLKKNKNLPQKQYERGMYYV